MNASAGSFSSGAPGASFALLGKQAAAHVFDSPAD
jgi:hypothetical protein